MKGWKSGLLLLVFIALISCSDEPAKARKDPGTGKNPPLAEAVRVQESPARTAGEEAQIPPANPASPAPDANEKEAEEKGKMPAPGEEEIRHADRIIAFSNQSRDILQSGIYEAADILRDNALYYRENWTLPSRPKLPARHGGDPRLKARSGIFTEEEEERLARALDGMDKALNEIISSYRSLEKYLKDSSIIDDGKKGLELSGKLLQSHVQYTKARKSWMEIVEARAEDAEERLLYGHPLQKQIMAAKNIFRQMKEIAGLAAKKSCNREELNALRQNLAAIILEAGKPPFQAAPSLEREYRGFLKEAQNYCQILDRGILEGLHGVQKQELNMAAKNCREAYNKFVRAANGEGE